MKAKDLIKTQIDGAHQIVEGTVADVTDDIAHVPAPGKAHPIGATYAHIVMSEDFIVNMMVRGQQPLLMGEWAGKTGASEPPPPPGPGVYEWACRLKVDIPQMKQYAQAVYKNTLDYIDSLSDDDLGREMEVPGFGKNTVGYFMTISSVIHPSNHVGEISALKGIQGLKGYPF